METSGDEQPVATNSETARGADEPISRPDQDELHRSTFARALARQVDAAPKASGFVIGVTGPWGDGKTSVLNMASAYVTELAPGAIQFKFNPWLFESSGDLVNRFLLELGERLQHEQSLGGQVRSRLKRLMRDYGGVLGQLGEAVAQQLQRASAHDTRDELREELAVLGRPIVVFIDDIDRLTAAEIRDVMRLVKLVADFPWTVFVLAFDRERVERALAEGVGGREDDGRAYLEKIVQVSAELPRVMPTELEQLFERSLEDLSRRLDKPLPTSRRWRAIIHRVIGPQLRTLRDVRRYLAAAAMTIELANDEIDLADLLALEAIRLYVPEAHAFVLDHVDLLTRYWTPLLDTESDERHRAELQAFLETLGERVEPVRQLVNLVFPGAVRLLEPGTEFDSDAERIWRRERRVAVASNLLFYVGKAHGPGQIANADVAAIAQSLGDADELSSRLDALDGPRLSSLIDRLSEYEWELEPADYVVAAERFLAVASRLPRSKPQNMGFDEQGRLVDLIGRFLRLLPEDRRPDAYTRLESSAPDLSTRLLLIANTGAAEEDSRLPAVDLATLEAMKQRFEDDLHSASASELAEEQHLDRLVWVLARTPAGPERLREVGGDDRLFLRLIGKALYPAYDDSHRMFLPWEDLVAGFGHDWLERRIGEVEAQTPAGARQPLAVLVARHYLQHGEARPMDVHRPTEIL